MTAAFDIEGRFDRRLGLPTSVKATGGDAVALADARRFWSISEPFRMLVGCYRQDGLHKVFHTIHEFVLYDAMLDALFGDIGQSEVAAIHEGVSLARFRRDDYEAARKWAHAAVEALASRRGLISLNPKIDSKGQRRLQCSVSLRALTSLAAQYSSYFSGELEQTNHVIHQNQLGRIVLPLSLVSSQREFD